MSFAPPLKRNPSTIDVKTQAQRLSRNRGQPNRIERVEKSRQRLKNEMKRVREPSDADQEFGE